MPSLTSEEARELVNRRWRKAPAAERQARARAGAIAKRLRAMKQAETALMLMSEIYKMCTHELGWNRVAATEVCLAQNSHGAKKSKQKQ